MLTVAVEVLHKSYSVKLANPPPYTPWHLLLEVSHNTVQGRLDNEVGNQ